MEPYAPPMESCSPMSGASFWANGCMHRFGLAPIPGLGLPVKRFERAVKHFIGLAYASQHPATTCPHAMRLSSVPADSTSVSIAPDAPPHNYILTFHIRGAPLDLSC